jgi:hypothetical protein
MTHQNLSSLVLTDAQVQAAEASLLDIEYQLRDLIALSTAKRRSIIRMGDKSEAFCRQALGVLAQNPQVVPASVDLAGALSDLAALDRLRPMLHRLQRLTERAQDTEMALGSDCMTVALAGYQLLKVAGKNQGLEGLRKELGSRFFKGPRATEAEPA